MIADILRLVRQIVELENRVDDLETELTYLRQENTRLIGGLFERSNQTR